LILEDFGAISKEEDILEKMEQLLATRWGGQIYIHITFLSNMRG